MERFEILGAVALPVGRRIAMRWFKEIVPGFINDSHESRPNEPWIRDLETEIVYAPHWMVCQEIGVTFGEPQPLHSAIRPDIEADGETRFGIVRSCRLTTFLMSSSYMVQTTLMVEFEEAGTYRS